MRSQTANIDLDLANDAAIEFSKFSLAEVRQIVEAVGTKAAELAEELAASAVQETGFGVVADKVKKNLEFSKGFLDRHGREDYVSHRVNEEAGLLELPKTAGIVFALTPSTNPVATVYFKVLSALLTRNAIVISPHPAAKKTCIRAVEELAKIGESKGLPKGAVQIVNEPTVPLVEELMSHDRVSLILATGGGAMVKAAYRSGTPAIGVGPGNAPALVDDTADLAKAAAALIESKTFDNSVLCTAESGIIVTQLAASRLLRELEKRGGWLCRAEEKAKLSNYMYPEGRINPAVVGKNASQIAMDAGLSIPEGTKVLVVPIDNVVDAEPFTHEKLSPVLAWKVTPNFDTALAEVNKYLAITGQGHSAVIHSKTHQNVLDYSQQVRVHRIAVNTPGSTGGAGLGTNLPVTMSIGTGFIGGSASDTNFSPQQLVQWCRTTYSAEAKNEVKKFTALKARTESGLIETPNIENEELDSDVLRQIILEELQGLIGEGRRG